MKFLHTECTFNTDSEIPEVYALDLKLKLLELHGKATHFISSTLPVVQAAPARTIVDLKLVLKDGMLAE